MYKQVSAAFFVGVLVSSPFTAAYAAPGEIDSVNNGRDIVSGTYFNTAGNKTTFTNTSGSGLWLHSGDQIRGIETTGAGVPTGNGGSVLLSSPGSVVRIDGTINLDAQKSGSFFIGKGGSLEIQADYLYQNGNIFARGTNGGVVSINTSAATFTPLSTVDVSGTSGAGGYVHIDAGKGVVDIKKGAQLVTKGVTSFELNHNVIDVSGGIVNNEGVIRAIGVDEAGQNGGKIKLVAVDYETTAEYEHEVAYRQWLVDMYFQRMREALLSHTSPGHEPPPFWDGPPMPANEEALMKDAIQNNINNAGNMFTAGEATTIKTDIVSLLSNNNAASTVLNRGLLSVEGSNAVSGNGGNAGWVSLNAVNSIYNTGAIRANGGNGSVGNKGGNGGTVSLISMKNLMNGGSITANGGNYSGKGGTINIQTNNFNNTVNAVISLNGGAGANGGATGGDGGDGGTLQFNISSSNRNNGSIFVNGGNGGNGSTDGGNGGNAGTITKLGPASLVNNNSVQNTAGQSGTP